MVVALIRPGSWNLPLFVHLVGAFALVGGVFAVTVLALTAWRGRAHAALLAGLAFRTLLLVVLPGYVVMRVGAQWALGREHLDGGNPPAWVGLGLAISDAGVLVVVALLVLGWLGARRARKDGTVSVPARIVAVLAPLFLVALAIAWWAMTTKPA